MVTLVIVTFISLAVAVILFDGGLTLLGVITQTE